MYKKSVVCFTWCLEFYEAFEIWCSKIKRLINLSLVFREMASAYAWAVYISIFEWHIAGADPAVNRGAVAGFPLAHGSFCCVLAAPMFPH
jgi:hypothetical protein